MIKNYFGWDKHESDGISVGLVSVHDAYFTIDHTQVASRSDVTKSDKSVPSHESSVPSKTKLIGF